MTNSSTNRATAVLLVALLAATLLITAEAAPRKLQQLAPTVNAGAIVPQGLQGLVPESAFSSADSALDDTVKDLFNNELRPFGTPGSGIPVIGTLFDGLWTGVWEGGAGALLDNAVRPFYSVVG